ncbi:hypothetical protein Agau_P200441 (plasmid) [Agrobacterium tumefaciens F2]|uniref:Uncharacterized protein n=1 Tax=Brucella lupini TaxID=255457 RepID=A0A256GZX0_9HYPH|nr:hypothetical protein Agau_P200441 [Agrobacterium tumefaciens F2]OYR32727.1 hypothetical protein CES86_5607 [Brucella lupini]
MHIVTWKAFYFDTNCQYCFHSYREILETCDSTLSEAAGFGDHPATELRTALGSDR